MLNTILEALAVLIPIVIGLFGAGWGIAAWAKKMAKNAVKGKKYLKEVDDVLTAVAEDFADGDISTADLKRVFQEATDIFKLKDGINKVVKK